MRACPPRWLRLCSGSLLAFLVFCTGLTHLTFAQAPKAGTEADQISKNTILDERTFKVEAVEISGMADMKTGVKYPVAQGDLQKLYSAPWMKLSVEFSTVFDITDSVTLTFYMEGYDPLQTELNKDYMQVNHEKAKWVVLKGSTTMVNVPRGNKFQAAVFIHPATVARYGGKKGNGDDFLKKNNFRVEGVDPDGKIPALDHRKDDKDWVKKVEATIEHGLWNLTETPFWPFEFRQYNQIQR